MSHPSDINRKLIIVKLLALALTNLVLELANLLTILANLNQADLVNNQP